MNLRSDMLARIREALGRKEGARVAAPIGDYLARRPRGPVPPPEGDLVRRFRQRVVSLSSDVADAAGGKEVPPTVARYLAERGLPPKAVCWPSLAGLGWQESSLAVEARPASGDDLVGITGAFCAIAETGTLMMLSGPQTPASVSLLPETHVAVLPEDRIVPSMEDAWDLLRAEWEGPPRAVNFISGPSRTADIEQTVTLGAHGPYRVLIVLLRAG